MRYKKLFLRIYIIIRKKRSKTLDCYSMTKEFNEYVKEGVNFE